MPIVPIVPIVLFIVSLAAVVFFAAAVFRFERLPRGAEKLGFFGRAGARHQGNQGEECGDGVETATTREHYRSFFE